MEAENRSAKCRSKIRRSAVHGAKRTAWKHLPIGLLPKVFCRPAFFPDYFSWPDISWPRHFPIETFDTITWTIKTRHLLIVTFADPRHLLILQILTGHLLTETFANIDICWLYQWWSSLTCLLCWPDIYWPWHLLTVTFADRDICWPWHLLTKL